MAFFDLHPVTYWLPAGAALAWFVSLVVRSLWRAETGMGHPALQRDPLFLLSVLLLLLTVRWPYLTIGHELGPDESQQLAGALTLAKDPVYWKAVDGHTSGPANFYVLTLPAWLGLPVDYTTGRAVALLLVFLTLAASHQLMRVLHGADFARLCLASPVLFLALVPEWEFLHVSSEHLPMALTACGAFSLAAATRCQASRRRLAWGFAGLCFGLLPWSKLQAAPFGVLGALVGSWVWWRNRAQSGARVDLALWSCGLLVPGLLFLAAVLLAGEWTTFLLSYVQGSRHYVGKGMTPWETTVELWRIAWLSPSFMTLLLSTVLLFMAAAVLVRMRRAGSGPLLLPAVLAVGCTSFCLLAPGRAFQHYLLLALVPLILSLGAALAVLWNTLRGRRLIYLLGLPAALLIAQRAREPAPYGMGQWQLLGREPYTAVGEILAKGKAPGDTLSVWGWASQYYVETGLPQATRDAHTQRAIERNPAREQNRQRFLNDLRTAEPRWFVDAVGPGAFAFQDRVSQGHESFRELGSYIGQHYTLVAEIENARVYRWREETKP